MSHYDCKDCGHWMGISYGHCDNCTPPNVFELQRKLLFERSKAKGEWLAAHENELNDFIDSRVEAIETEYREALKKGKEDKWRAGK